MVFESHMFTNTPNLEIHDTGSLIPYVYLYLYLYFNASLFALAGITPHAS